MRAYGRYFCWLLAALASMVIGCAGPTCGCGQNAVTGDLESRAELDLHCPSCVGGLRLPNGATLEDGLGEEEAILIALWNNALFQETLVDLDLAEGDLV